MQDCSNESLRKRYKPKEIIALLVGEAPPSHDTFFYKCNSNLYRYTKEAFEDALGLKFKSCTDFLYFFYHRGFYLDDLWLEPINKDKRTQERQAGIAPLADRIKNCKPPYVIIVMKGIQKHVRQAVSQASVTPREICVLDFPARSHHLDYVRNLSTIIRKLIVENEIQKSEI